MNLLSIIYQLVLINYEDQDIIELLLKQVLLKSDILKERTDIELKLFLLFTINEILKINQSELQRKYTEKYSNFFKNYLNNLDKFKKQSNINFKLEWWDRNTNENNFLFSNELLLNQKKFYQEVEFNPSFLNKFYNSDYKVNNNVYEFISPFHLINSRNTNDISTLNNYYINKKLIFENHGLNLNYLDYFESIKKFNQKTDIFIN